MLKNLIWQVKSSLKELNNVPTVSVTGMLVALSVVLSFFTIVISNVLQISFGFLPLAVGGMLFGPVVGGIMGILSDILGYFVHPNGPFFPGFTLNALLTGTLYGFFLYKKHVTLKRVIFVSLTITLLVNMMLNPLWLSIMYGNAFFVLVIGRIVKNLLMFPINTALLYSILKPMERIRTLERVSG
ncbi:folate family ECF transporter S component [Lacrimispora saccharolytica]|uniref:Folate family ECF transporter S component n=1 Tax=Lacrimispora saccharolytica (strain ATCC 35040 / DSM 2544 / NRCC 2533 / WM1) TaxID=610130 RepID=D9R7L7_LACSW|nr:folate family ECF transporter S component [Lacrimispora saccharolytica]ADL03746.1 conserved hypothetical protein [[Clostridium] saccharolyticum WM1]QRV18123.1 folate family ECF transporter S component [Lacrimispora saccharolytica]